MEPPGGAAAQPRSSWSAAFRWPPAAPLQLANWQALLAELGWPGDAGAAWQELAALCQPAGAPDSWAAECSSLAPEDLQRLYASPGYADDSAAAQQQLHTLLRAAHARAQQTSGAGAQLSAEAFAAAVLGGDEALPDQDIAAADAVAAARLWGPADTATSFLLPVPPEAMTELAAAARRLVRQGVTYDTVSVADAGPLPAVDAFAHTLTHRLTRGSGVAVVRLDLAALGEGLAKEEGESAAALAYYLLCAATGPVLPSPMGRRLYEVRDRKLDVRKDNVFFSSTAAAAPFHTDNSRHARQPLDFFALLCIRPASGPGGELQLSNAANALASLQARLPPLLLQELRRPILVDMIGSGQGAEGDALRALGRSPEVMALRVRADRYPLFRTWGPGCMTFKHTKFWIQTGHDKVGAPVSPLLRIAVDLLHAELARSAAFDRRLEPGEAVFVNDHFITHARAAFAERADCEGRLMMRAWMLADERILLQ